MFFRQLFLASTFSVSVLANNDWTKPCFSGVCEYDLPTAAGSASGTLKIWGTENSIGDITPAGGWEIIDCSPKAVDQDIRLVCKEGRTSDCSLLHSAGAEGKIVRLPESCGLNAFAVVTSSWVPVDQSVPSGWKVALARRDGSTPEVRALRLSTKFYEVDTSRKTTGAVNFAIQAANVHGAAGEIPLGTNQRRNIGRISERGLFDFIGKAIDKITSLNDFDVDKSTKLLPFNVDKIFNLVDERLSCPPLDAQLKIDVDAKAQGAATIGVAVSGTILPPKIEDFALISSLSADLQGSIDVVAGIKGKLDSGKKTLVDLPIAGIDFPGILSLGPSFKVDAQTQASLDVDVGLTVGINYKVDKAQLVFPPSSKKASGGSFKVGDTPLKLSASAGVNAKGTINAHLIPSLNVGLSVFAGAVKANVFLELDGSASLTLGLEAAAEANVSVKRVSKRESIQIRGVTTPGHYFWNPAERSENHHKTKAAHHGVSHTKTSAVECSPATVTVFKTGHPGSIATQTSSPAKVTSVPGAKKPTSSPTGVQAGSKVLLSAASSPIVKSAASPSVLAPVAVPSKIPNADKEVKTSTDASFSGCIEIDAGLDVNAGADANFFGLFNKDTKVSLFSKKFELLMKCFGKSISKRSPYSSVISRFSRDLISSVGLPTQRNENSSNERSLTSCVLLQARHLLNQWLIRLFLLLRSNKFKLHSVQSQLGKVFLVGGGDFLVAMLV